jgi:hypothetical protein
MKKKGIANKFQTDFKNVISNGENVVEIQSGSNFSFFEIVKIEPPNNVQSFFIFERDPFMAHKTSIFVSFT